MESPRPSSEIISFTNTKRNSNNPDTTLDDTKHQLFLLESKILIELDFDLDFEVPRTYLIQFDYKYKAESKAQFEKCFPDDIDANNLFKEIWAFQIELTSKLLNDTFYSPM